MGGLTSLHWVAPPEYLSCFYRPQTLYFLSKQVSTLSFMINSQVPFTSPSLWGFHLSLKLTDTTLTLKDTYLLILLCTLWKPNEVWKPAEPRIIFYRFCWGRVVTTVTSLIEFDKKWWLAILWKHFIFCATYWNHCGGAITSHNLATVQTGKMLLLSLQKGKCLLWQYSFILRFSKFISISWETEILFEKIIQNIL